MSVLERVSEWSPRRLVVIFVLVCLLPLVGLTVAESELSWRAVDAEVRDRVETTAEFSATSVQRDLDSLAELVHSYARRPYVVQAMGDGTASSVDRARIATTLEELRGARRGIVLAFAIEADGVALDVRPATPGIVGQSQAQQDWYRGVGATGRPHVSGAYQPGAGQPHVVAAAAPVRDAGPGSKGTGRDLGVLVVGYTLEAVDRAGQVGGSDVRVSVTDQRGALLARPAFDGREPALRRDDPAVDRALAGRVGILSEERDGDTVLRAYAPVRGLGWSVVAEVDEDLAFAAARESGRLSSLIKVLRGGVLLIGILLLVLVLRARHRAGERLRTSEERSRAVIEAADEAYVSMNADGAVTGWNGRAEDTFGWTADEAVGRRLSELIVPPQHRRAHEVGLRRAIETHEGPVLNNRIEITAMHRDGHEFPVELSIWPMWDDTTATFNAFLHDISQRKDAEAALAQRSELLAEARDTAIEASQLKSAFLANMSHEIRTPMNGVIGMTSLLLDTELDPQQREYAETVRLSAESLLGVINDILDFSKIEAGRLDIEHVDFLLRNAIEESAEVLADRAQQKGIELAVLVAPDVPSVVVGDPGRLRQVLINLIGNAVKFTDAGEVVVRVTAVDDAAPVEGATWVRFAISDTGVGVPAEHLERLFEPFSQADASTSRRFGGTGLGLAICTQLVDLMDGRIEATSTFGEGSTFSFELPLRVGEGVDLVATGPLESLRARRIVVVDDNATNRAILEDYLQSWGMTVTSFERGQEAIDGMAALAGHGHRVDVALLDYQMPEMDGLDLARRIAAVDPSIPMVLLTSAAQRGDSQAAAAAGVAGYLTKPVRASQLYGMLAAVLTGTSAPVGRPRAPMITRHTLAPADGPLPRVLLAEDNPVNQTVALRMVERLGFQVDVVADGASAVAALAAEPTAYAVVLMDCQMPGVDGYEATAQIRSREGVGPRTPIIAMTAGAMTGDRERCLAAGMDDYLAKPVRPEDLEAILGRWAGFGALDELDAPSAQAAGPTGHGAEATSSPATRPTGHDAASPLIVADESSADQVLDLKAVAHLRSLEERSGKPIVEEIAVMFLSSVPERLEAVRQAVEVGDLSLAGSSAHYLKGSSSGVGATLLADACGALEVAADAGDMAAVTAALLDLEAAAARTMPAVEALRT